MLCFSSKDSLQKVLKLFLMILLGSFTQEYCREDFSIAFLARYLANFQQVSTLQDRSSPRNSKLS